MASMDSRGSLDRKDFTPQVPLQDNKVTAFVPPAPSTAIDKHFDDSKLGKTLNKGRLSIKCISGRCLWFDVLMCCLICSFFTCIAYC